MKRIKNMMKKGGLADIVTLMIIVGLVIGLIVAVVIPMINDTTARRGTNETQMTNIDNTVSTKIATGLSNWN